MNIQPQLGLEEPKAKALPTSAKSQFTACVYFDGGCGPTNPGNKYGSFELRLDGKIIGAKSRITFGWGTNNEAEFDALLIALDALAQGVSAPGLIRVMIQSDSLIVCNWLNRFERYSRRKMKNERRLVMCDYARRCVEKLKPFHSFEAVWKSRDDNVARFGH